MYEYIPKQAPIIFIDNCLLHEDKFQGVEKETLLAVKKQIEAIPTADVRPVVRGKWEVVDWVEYDEQGECVHYPKEGLCCTSCKNVFKKKLLWKNNYCPNCGADMIEYAIIR